MQFNMDLKSHWNRFVLAVCICVMAGSAVAQVKLENTIRMLETFVNSDGEVERRMVDANSVVPGDELQYVVRFVNQGDLPVDAGTIVITDAIPANTVYVDGTAFGAGADVSFSIDGVRFAPPSDLTVVKDGVPVPAGAQDYTSIRWSFAPTLDPGAAGHVTFNVRLK
jgi:uncharacterized repeat protein (TIGR01451 family)